MKFSQVIEYNMINIYHEKTYIKYGDNTSPRPFSRKSKLSVFPDQQSKSFIQFVFINFVFIVRCRPLALTSYKTFPKHKMRSGISSGLSSA